MRRFIMAVFSFCTAATVVSCSGKKHMKTEFTEENKAIPPTFGKDKEAVLICVLQGRGTYDRYLKSAAKNYSGPVAFVKYDELESDPYSDKTKYRYLFDYGSGSTVHYSNGPSVNVKRFHVVDRLENKKYESGAEFSFFAKAMKVYMANLETKRQSML